MKELRPDTVDMFHDTKRWGLMAIRDLEDGHLVNVVAYLDRNVVEWRTAYGMALFCSGPEISGDMANDALDAAMAEDARKSDVAWLHTTPLYRALKREIKRRGL